MKGNNQIRERLNRAIANSEWREKFPLVHVKNGDPLYSDHRPIVISIDRLPPRRSRNENDSFKFEASWLKEEDCRRVVEEAWSSSEGSGCRSVTI